MSRARLVALRQVAKKQEGVLSRAQALEAGVGAGALRWLLRSGDLERVSASVYRLPSPEPTWDAQAMAALLAAGPMGALSHASAAWLWRLDLQAEPPEPIEVTVPYLVRSRGAKGQRVHRTRLAMETVRLGKFTVTTLPRTLVDLAAVCPAPRGAADALGDALDTAQRLHPTTARQLQRVLRDLGAGVKGVERLRALLAERHGSTDSSLESRAVRRIRDAGLSTPELQYTIFDERGYIMRADCAWPDERLVLHVDGYRYHQQRTRFERDRVAVSRLAAAGWLSMWVTHRSLESNQWLENLRTALAARAPHLQAG